MNRYYLQAPDGQCLYSVIVAPPTNWPVQP